MQNDLSPYSFTTDATASGGLASGDCGTTVVTLQVTDGITVRVVNLDGCPCGSRDSVVEYQGKRYSPSDYETMRTLMMVCNGANWPYWKQLPRSCASCGRSWPQGAV